MSTLDNPSAAIWNEQEMIAQLLSGDTAAFSGLYDRYSGALYGLILNIVENEADAENLLQDAFVKIWRNFNLRMQHRRKSYPPQSRRLP